MAKTVNFFWAFLFCVIFVVFCENSENSASTQSDLGDFVLIRLTLDNFEQIISEKIVPYKKGLTVMDITAKNFEVVTSHGGSFVFSIDGLSSKSASGATGGNDWFYYVNGKEASVGASDFLIGPGDVINWDFRKWTMDGITERFLNR